MNGQYSIEQSIATCQKISKSSSFNCFNNNRIFRTISMKLSFFGLLVVVMVANSTAFSQDYQYQFQLQGVSDLGSAKQVTDVLRPVFNTEENPFVVFPSFSDATDQFDFVSKQLVSKGELEAILASKGIVLLSFTSREIVQSETEKR